MYNIIAAVDEDNLIGCDNKLAYHIPDDLRHFRRVTMSVKDPQKINAIVMGRKTWESLPGPLPGRMNCVISKTLKPSNVHHYDSFEDCIISLSNLTIIDKIFVIGGSQLYKTALDYDNVDKIYLTKIHRTTECACNPVYFPSIPDSYKVVKSTEHDYFSFEILLKDTKSI